MSTTITSSTPSAKTPSKTAKQTRKIILHLRPELLASFPRTPSASIAASSASADGTTSQPNTKGDNRDESNDPSTPLASTTANETPDPDATKKKGPGARAGIKRNSSAATLDALGRSKGRPGPKKKPRLADGTIDRSNDSGPRPVVTGTTAAAHKLNPKANTGAINANLRALDRTGKPCRKWERQGFNLKSFTGVGWGIGSWSAPRRASTTFSGDVKSDSSSAGDLKPALNGSGLQSDSSRADEVNGSHANGIASSPVPIPA